MQSGYNLYLHKLERQHLLLAIAICAFMTTLIQGLGDKENMYGLGSVLPYKLCEWMHGTELCLYP